jgi:hypothetical protein
MAHGKALFSGSGDYKKKSTLPAILLDMHVLLRVVLCNQTLISVPFAS